MDFEQTDGPGPGQHYRPTTSAEVQFNQRTVPAFLFAALGYGILCAFTPHDVGETLWAGIALVALPAANGLIIHSIGDAVSIHRRAKRAFTLTFVLFLTYAFVNLAMIHDRLQAPSVGLGALPAMAMSAFGYGVIAATIAGITASLPIHHHTEHGS